jgi:hypothetical protein
MHVLVLFLVLSYTRHWLGGCSALGGGAVGRATAKLEAGTECGSHHRRSSNHSNHSGLRRCGCYGGCLNGSDHY